MEALLAEHERLSKSGTLQKSLDDVQKTIDLLVKARERIAAGEHPLRSSHPKSRRQIADATTPS